MLKAILRVGNERSIKYKRNSILIILLQGFNVLANFLLVTVVLNFLGVEEYGVWVTLTTMIAWFSFLDIGLAHGLRNRYAEAKVKGDVNQIKGLISTAFFTLLFICIISLIILSAVGYWINWSWLLNASKNLESDLKIIGLTMIASFCLRIVVNLVAILKAADQEPFVNNLLITSGNVLSLVLIFIAVRYFHPGFRTLGIIIGISQVFPFLLAFFFYFATTYNNYFPKWKFYSQKYLKSIFNIGYKFFLIQLFNLLLLQSNILIIAHICGQKAVTEYNIAYKYLWPLMILFTSIIIPLWSASTEAYMQNDIHWFTRTMKNLKKVWIVLVLGGLILLLIAPWIYEFWLKGKLKVNFLLLALMLIYFISTMWFSMYRMFMNGVGKIGLQFVSILSQSLLHVPLAILLASTFNLYGVLVIMIIWNIINCIWEPVQYKKIVSGTASGLWNK